MSFDVKVPKNLRKIQEWFGKIITQPIDTHSRINPVTPSGQSIEKESALFISPSPTLQPSDRIQIYNQQYWWRLLSSLHESFPFLLRLFGYREFNQKIAIPYLVKYPPNHWALNFLGQRLLRWVQEDYHEEDRELILDVTYMDWAYNFCFSAAHFTSLATQSLSQEVLLEELYLQPHLCLFELSCNLFKFREEFTAQDPDYWIDHDFPQLNKDKDYHFVLFRNLRNHIIYEQISQGEYKLLHQFQKGKSIELAIAWLETEGKDNYEEALSNLHLWLQKWVFYQWLTPETKGVTP
jgi:hypothetical protein